MPYVVPQLKTITLGGAVTGLGIESTSFSRGLPHESVEEMEILTGDGRVVVARPEGEHADLFRSFPNSYGTLGYALRIRIKLAKVKPFVRLTHIRFTEADKCMLAMQEICENRAYDGEPVTSSTAPTSGRTRCTSRSARSRTARPTRPTTPACGSTTSPSAAAPATG